MPERSDEDARGAAGLDDAAETAGSADTADAADTRLSLRRRARDAAVAAADGSGAADATATTTSDRTRPSARNRPITTIPAGRRPFAVALPSHPPVTDYRRLDFSPPEVLPGRVAHYPVRATATTRDLPAFVVVHEASERVATLPARRDVGGVLTAEQRRARRWASRLAWTIAAATAGALVVAGAGLYGLARL